MWPLLDIYFKILSLKKGAKDLPYSIALFLISFSLTLFLESAFITGSGGAPAGRAFFLSLFSSSLVFITVVSYLFKAVGYPERRVQVFSALWGSELLLFSFWLVALRFLVLFERAGILFFFVLNGWQLVVHVRILAEGLEIPIWKAILLLLFVSLMKSAIALLVLRALTAFPS